MVDYLLVQQLMARADRAATEYRCPFVTELKHSGDGEHREMLLQARAMRAADDWNDPATASSHSSARGICYSYVPRLNMIVWSCGDALSGEFEAR